MKSINLPVDQLPAPGMAEAKPEETPPANDLNRFKVTLKGREIDFSTAVPLNNGDWRVLSRHPDEHLQVTFRHLENAEKFFDNDKITSIATRVLQKVDPTITIDDVDTLAFADVSRVFAIAMGVGAEERVNRPT